MNCEECIFEEEESDTEYETKDGAAGPLALGLGAIIAVGAINIEDDSDVMVQCEITKIEGEDIECEVVSIDKEEFYRIEGHQGTQAVSNMS